MVSHGLVARSLLRNKSARPVAFVAEEEVSTDFVLTLTSVLHNLVPHELADRIADTRE